MLDSLLILSLIIFCLCVSIDNQQQRSKHLEDKIRLLQNAKDDLQQHSSQQTQLIGELQAKHSNDSLEIDSLKRKLSELNQVL